MSQGPLCPNLSQKVQAEVSQMANRNLSRVILLGGLSVNSIIKEPGKVKITVRSRQNSNFQHRPCREDNRELPRGSYTQIMVNPTQLLDKEFAAWMDRLVEARRNRQENKPRPYRQFRKPLLRNRGELGELPQEHLRNKIKPAEELDTREIMSHMRCELVDIEEAVDMYNLDVEECRST